MEVAVTRRSAFWGVPLFSYHLDAARLQLEKLRHEHKLLVHPDCLYIRSAPGEEIDEMTLRVLDDEAPQVGDVFDRGRAWSGSTPCHLTIRGGFVPVSLRRK